MGAVDAEFRRVTKDGSAVGAGTRQRRRAFLAILCSRAILVLAVRANHLNLLTRICCKTVFRPCPPTPETPFICAHLQDQSCATGESDLRMTTMTGEHTHPSVLDRAFPTFPGLCRILTPDRRPNPLG